MHEEDSIMAGRTASKQIGALWRRTAKQGETGDFLKGVLDLGALGQVPIVVFKNTRKKKDNEPDYRIVLSAPYGKTKPEVDRAGDAGQSANTATPRARQRRKGAGNDEDVSR
jgi:uncharacterized protein (DUF736 family)